MGTAHHVFPSNHAVIHVLFFELPRVPRLMMRGKGRMHSLAWASHLYLMRVPGPPRTLSSVSRVDLLPHGVPSPTKQPFHWPLPYPDTCTERMPCFILHGRPRIQCSQAVRSSPRSAVQDTDTVGGRVGACSPPSPQNQKETAHGWVSKGEHDLGLACRSAGPCLKTSVTVPPPPPP